MLFRVVFFSICLQKIFAWQTNKFEVQLNKVSEEKMEMCHQENKEFMYTHWGDEEQKEGSFKDKINSIAVQPYWWHFIAFVQIVIGIII